MYLPYSRPRLIEIHEQTWCPPFLRQSVQVMLTAVWTTRVPPFQSLAPYEAVSDTLESLIADIETEDATSGEKMDRLRIVDFCSGAGGPMAAIEKRLNTHRFQSAKSPIPIILSDLHPHLSSWEAQTRASQSLSFLPYPVDATRAPEALTQERHFRTFCLAFHHFGEEGARRVLEDAMRTAEGIGIFELQEPTLASLFTVSLLFPLCWLLTPFHRPSLTTLVFTYLIPLIPIILVVDGYTSAYRTPRPSPFRRVSPPDLAPKSPATLTPRRSDIPPARAKHHAVKGPSRFRQSTGDTLASGGTPVDRKSSGGQLPATTESIHKLTLPPWSAGVTVASPLDSRSGYDGYFPEIVSQASLEAHEPDMDDWELRTETVGKSYEYDDPTLDTLQTNHARQLTHYKNLLVRAQSASSAELHELHSKLLDVEGKFAALKAEHAGCAGTLVKAKKHSAKERGKEGVEHDVASAIADGKGLAGVVKRLGKEDRVTLLGVIAEACNPSDIATQIAILKKYRRSRLDILGRLDNELVVKVLALLEVKEILQLRLVSGHGQLGSKVDGLRQVSKSYKSLVDSQALWRTLCRQLEWRDWDGELGLAASNRMPDEGWEELYKSLWRREQNWNAGLAQQVTLLDGHTNYVTSLKLRGDILISGSYDERSRLDFTFRRKSGKTLTNIRSIRIWHLPALRRNPSAPLILPAKAVSCLDFYPSENVFVVGSHDIGRVLVFRKEGESWELQHTLAGHLHGIRAVAIGEKWLISAGADKALVVWDWRTGQKVVRFGQQTNICVGIQLVHDQIIAVTVDGIIRTFSIRQRQMLSEYKISHLGKMSSSEMRARLRDIGGGPGGVGMITWFEGQGRFVTVATRDMIIRLEWEEVEVEILPDLPVTNVGTPVSSPGIRTISSTSKAVSASNTPTRRSTTLTPQKVLTNPSTPLRKHSSTAMLRSSSIGPTSSPSPSTSSRRPSPSVRSSAVSQHPFLAPTPQNPLSMGMSKTRRVPLLTKAPRLLELIDAPDVERGAVDAQRTRVVTSTRFASRTGADRHLYVGVPMGGRTEMVSVNGAWRDKAAELSLQTPGMNPMSLVLDREKFVVRLGRLPTDDGKLISHLNRSMGAQTEPLWSSASWGGTIWREYVDDRKDISLSPCELFSLCDSFAEWLAPAAPPWGWPPLFVPSERGTPVSIYAIGPMAGPIAGSMIGIWVLTAGGWRWPFWTITLLAAANMGLILTTMRETHAPTVKKILTYQAHHPRTEATSFLSKLSPSRQLHNLGWMTAMVSASDAREVFGKAFSRPPRILLGNPVAFAASAYYAYIYAIIYVFIVSTPLLFGSPPFDKPGLFSYMWPQSSLPAAYVGLGIGFLTAATIAANSQDRIYRFLSNRNGDDKSGQPEYRLVLTQIGVSLMPIGLFIYSWTAQAQTHWMGPCIGQFVIALGLMLAFNTLQAFIVDCFFPYSAAAIAGATALRSITACLLPIFSADLFGNLGWGWGGSLLAFVAIAGIPFPLMMFKYGKRLRERYQFEE
ncbi:hypothetical protein P7C73_g2033, partial [Tremellales sp. Uapishka_1]